MTTEIIDLLEAGVGLHKAAVAERNEPAVKTAVEIIGASLQMLRPPAGPSRLPADGWLVKANSEKRVAHFVVYSASKMPARGADHRIDVATPDVLEDACWKFAENGFRIGVGHRPGGEGAATVLENFIHRGAPWHVVGPDGVEQVVSPGDWVIALRFPPDAWERFKSGEWGGVSLQGAAKRKPATLETLANQRS